MKLYKFEYYLKGYDGNVAWGYLVVLLRMGAMDGICFSKGYDSFESVNRVGYIKLYIEDEE